MFFMLYPKSAQHWMGDAAIIKRQRGGCGSGSSKGCAPSIKPTTTTTGAGRIWWGRSRAEELKPSICCCCCCCIDEVKFFFGDDDCCGCGRRQQRQRRWRWWTTWFYRCYSCCCCSFDIIGWFWLWLCCLATRWLYLRCPACPLYVLVFHASVFPHLAPTSCRCACNVCL